MHESCCISIFNGTCAFACKCEPTIWSQYWHAGLWSLSKVNSCIMTPSIRKTNIWEPIGFYAVSYQFQELRIYVYFVRGEFPHYSTLSSLLFWSSLRFTLSQFLPDFRQKASVIIFNFNTWMRSTWSSYFKKFTDIDKVHIISPLHTSR